MFPTSTPRLIVSVPIPQRGQMSPSLTSCASTRSPSKSRPRTTRSSSAACWFAPATNRRAATHEARLAVLAGRVPRGAELRGGAGLGEAPGWERARGLLHVGSVGPPRAEQDAVVAGLRQRLKLVRDVAAHGTGVRLAADGVE